MKKKKIKNKRIILIIFKILIEICIVYNVCYSINTTITKKEYFSVLGISFFDVNNKNMEPDLKKNDFIITKNISKYVKGDVIVYITSDQIKIGQIIEEKKEDKKDYYSVKINNTYYPESIKKTQIIGKKIVKIPLIGFILELLQTKFLTIFIFLLLIFIFFYNRYKYLKNLDRQRKKKKYNNNYWNE